MRIDETEAGAATVVSVPDFHVAMVPDLPGTLRVTFMLEDWTGAVGFFDPDELFRLVAALDDTPAPDGGGTTCLRAVSSVEGLTRVRQAAIDLFVADRTSNCGAALLALAYCSLRHPAQGRRVLAAAREKLAEHGRANIVLVRDRGTDRFDTVVAHAFDARVIAQALLSRPPLGEAGHGIVERVFDPRTGKVVAGASPS